MARLSRLTGRIFASSSGANEIAKFGSLAAGTPLFTTDPAVAQSLANWLEGWFAAVEGGNSPAIEDMNAFCFVLSYITCYLLQVGVSEWDSGTTYFTGDITSSGGALYVSLTDNNLNNAVTVTANWRAMAAGLYSAVLGSAAQVTSGQAQYSTWASAIAGLSAGATLRVLPGAWTENVTFTKQIQVEGSGFGSVLTGNITFNNVSDCSLKGIKVTSTITLDATSASNYVSEIWQTNAVAGSTTWIDNGSGNFAGTIFPV